MTADLSCIAVIDRFIASN